MSCNELLRKNFSIWIKSDFLWLFKNLKILFSCGRPIPLITRLTCPELWCRFRNVWLQAWLIDLFYLCKFSFVVHAKCSFPTYCMDCWVKFTEVKQARRVKPEVPCSWMLQLIPNQGKTGTNGGPNWQQIWTFSKLIKEIESDETSNSGMP